MKMKTKDKRNIKTLTQILSEIIRTIAEWNTNQPNKIESVIRNAAAAAVTYSLFEVST